MCYGNVRIVTESIHAHYLKKQIGLVHFVQIEKNFRIFNTLNETHPYLREFWDLSNERDFSEYWFKSNNVVSWVCPCCKINFQCSPAEMISRTDLENQNFQTCPNQCDWRTEVFKNNIFLKRSQS